MALTTAELVSGLFGFWSMGLAVWLFMPEFVDVWRHPMPEIDLPRFVFFGAWLVGDAVMLAGLLIVRKYIITQMVLYTIIMVLEVAILLLMMWTVGDLCCAARAKRPSDNAMGHLITGIHGRLHMPPGDDSLEKRQAARARERGELTPKQRQRRNVGVQVGGTVVVLAIFTVVWLVVDFLRREDKAPPPISSLPDPAKSDYVAKMTAYSMAWFGFPCWTVPRVYCLVQSYRMRAKEGITVASISIGGLLHILNIASVMLINPSGEPLLAQLPYLATSIACVALDGMRLGLTYVLRNAKQLPPEYDYSKMWPYERYLPDYDPEDYADVKGKIQSQPIFPWHKHTKPVPSSEDESPARPSEKVDRKHRRVHVHHALVLKNNAFASNALTETYPDMRPEAARPEHSRKERLALDERNEDRRIRIVANQQWAAFRQKEVKLRHLQHALDAAKEETLELEREHAQDRRAHGEDRSSHGWVALDRAILRSQRKEHAIQEQIHALIARPTRRGSTPTANLHASVSSASGGSDTLAAESDDHHRAHSPEPRPLTLHYQLALETEQAAYVKYSRKRDLELKDLQNKRLEATRKRLEETTSPEWRKELEDSFDRAMSSPSDSSSSQVGETDSDHSELEGPLLSHSNSKASRRNRRHPPSAHHHR